MSVGTARKNENSVAAGRDKPKSMPPMMVAPEREVPGIRAKHCAMPTLSASRQFIVRVDSTRAGRAPRSTTRMTMPPMMNARATGIGEKR